MSNDVDPYIAITGCMAEATERNARLAAAYRRAIDGQRLAAYLGTRRTRRQYKRPRPRGDRR